MIYETISVIIPIFNSEKTLKKCVDSVRSSTYHALEIILVDDGSTDSSGEICDSLMQTDERIKVFHLENGGVSKARNFGLRIAEGSFVAFVDSDDYVEPDYFEELKRTYTPESQLSVGSVVYVDGVDKRIVSAHEGQVIFQRGSEEDHELFLEWNRLFLLYGPVNKLYSKKIIQENHIFFPEDTSYGEDLLFSLQYIACIEVVTYRQKPVYYYVNSGGNSLSRKYRENRFENGLRLNLALKQMFESKGFYSAAEEKYVYQRIFDDAYNAIFDLWNPQCSMDHSAKRKRIHFILSQEDVIHACRISETKNYSKIYTFMIKQRMCRALVALREAKQHIDGLFHS